MSAYFSKLVTSPRFWLAVQLIAIAVLGGLRGCWQVQIHPDSPEYIETSRMGLEEALRQTRTLGYPLILRAVGAFAPDYTAIPWLQLAMLWSAVFLLDTALRHFGATRWQSFVVSSGFMYGSIQLLYTVASVLTDFPAMLVAGMAIACLLWVITYPTSGPGWLGLTFLVAASYHLRPAYLFMIPLVPALGTVLLQLRAKKSGADFASRKVLLALFSVSLLPFLAFCTIRWTVVGHFGLVSYGGASSIGLAAELLDPQTIESGLSERYKPLGLAILQGRQERRLKPAFGEWGWVNLRTYEHNYCKNIFLIAEPAAKRLFGEDPIVTNREMSQFSLEVRRMHIGKYLLWAAYYWPWAVVVIGYRYWILQIAIPLTLLLMTMRRYSVFHRPNHPQLASSATEEDKFVLRTVIWLNLLYFGGSVSVLVLAGSYPDSRLIAPAGVYLPSLVGLFLLREVTMWRHQTAG